MSAKTFTCRFCGGTFEMGRSEQEAIDEARRLFGEHRADDGIVCEDCFRAIEKAMGGWPRH